MTSTLFKRCVAFALTFALIMSNAYVAPATSDAAAKVSLNKKSVSLTVAQNGEKITRGTATLKIKKSKKIKIKKTTYKVADTDVATVNKSGKITAKSTGTTKVNVTVNYKLKKKSYKKTLKCDVKVNNTYKNVLSDIKLNYANYATYVGAVIGAKPSYVAKVKLNDDFYLYDCLKVTIDDPSIIKLGEAGYMMGLKEGTTKITISTTDGSNISKSANVKVYATANDVPVTDDMYLKEQTQKTTELLSKWTEEDKVRYTEDDGSIKWNYAEEVNNIYEDNLNKLLETYKKAGKQEDNTSKDVLQCLFSTAKTIYTKEGKETYFKDIKDNIITPILETKSTNELLELSGKFAHDGINSIVNVNGFKFIINNEDQLKDTVAGKIPAPDNELNTQYCYYPLVKPTEQYLENYTTKSGYKYMSEYISSLFKMFDIDSNISNDTTQIIKTLSLKEYNTEAKNMTLKEFKSSYPHLATILTGAEYSINDDTEVYLEHDDLLSRLEAAFNSEDNLNALKGYAIATIVNPLIDYTETGRGINYRFSMAEDGESQTEEEIKASVKEQQDSIVESLTTDIQWDIDHVYTETYYSKNYKPEFDEIVNLFKEQYKETISSCWMGDKAKKNMLDKIDNMMFSSLYPTEEEYKMFCVKDDLKNAEEGGHFFDTIRSIRKNLAYLNRMTVNKDITKYNWWEPVRDIYDGVHAWDMNAFYDANVNQAYLCHAFLANVFFENPDNSKEIDVMNISYMAATIGHEVGHAFDGTGNCFNSKGNIQNLWSDEDKATYQNKTAKLADLFGTTFAVADYDKNLAYYQNGYDVVNEAMADLGGFEIGLKIIKKMYPNDEEALKDYYSYYVGQWVTTDEDKMTADKIEWRLKDPHPMYKNRANTIISMSDDFYKVFNIKETDAMYVAPEDRVTLWN